jgi:hypothetical protein
VSRRHRIVAAAWLALAILLAVLLWRSWQGPDIFYHLAIGREVVATGSPEPPDRVLVEQPAYRNIYWIFQVVVYGVWKAAGPTGVSALFGVLWLAIAVVWVRTTGANHHPVVGPPLALAALLVVQVRFDLRPEVVSYLLLAVQIERLVRWRPARDAWLPTAAAFALTEALWVNVHGYYVLGPALVAARLTAAVAGREEATAVRRLAGLLAVTAAATLASPLGPGAWRFAATLAVFLRDMGGEIAEFGPPTGAFLSLWAVWVFWALWLATLVAAGRLLVRRRLGFFAAALAAGALALSASSFRNLPLLVLLGAPLWRDVLDAGWPDAPPHGASRWRRLASLAAASTAAAALAGAGWVVGGGFYASLRSDARFGVTLPAHAYPLRAAAYLERHGARGRIFNSAADGGYLELAFPELRVCMDSRYVEAAVVRRYFAALTDPAAFARLDAELGFDAVLLRIVDSGRPAVALLRDPDWELVWADLHRALWVRRDGPLAGRWPPAGLALAGGEDLSDPVNGLAAIQWTAIAVEVGDRDLVLEVLDQIGRSPAIPSFVIQYALQLGLATGDREVFDRGRAMVPRMVARAPEHRMAVERLLGQR